MKSQQTSQTKKKCAYCGLADSKYLIKCECGKYFCNGTGDGIFSHIIHHLARSKHQDIKLPSNSRMANCSLGCISCTNKNPFALGTISSKVKNSKTVICRDCRYKNTDFDRIEWDRDNFESIIVDNHFVEWVAPIPSLERFKMIDEISFNEMRQKEYEWKQSSERSNSKIFYYESIHQVYANYRDCEDYFNTFDPLIKVEAKIDKEKRETENLTNITLEFETERKEANFNDEIFVKFEKPFNEEIRLSLYDIVILYLPNKGKTLTVNEIHNFDSYDEEEKLAFMSKLNTYLYGKINEVNKDKIIVKLSISPLLPKEKQYLTNIHKQAKFNCCFEWLSIPFKRMASALNEFKRSDENPMPGQMSEYLRRRILGYPRNEVDMLNEEVFREEKEEYLKEHNTRESMSAPNLPQLNEVQFKVVVNSFKQQLSLIQGPPGTGKTVTSATIVYHAAKANPGKKILVCASSNIAVDQLGLKLIQTGLKVCRVYGKSRDSDSELLSAYSLKRYAEQELIHNPEIYKIYQKKVYGEELTKEESTQLKIKRESIELDILRKHDIICTTCCVAGDSRLKGILDHIDTVLIDESTQAEEPECLVALMNSVRQLFLVGDHCQLGPVLNSKEARRNGLQLPMFSRLLQLGHEPNRLQIQYRMHPALSEFSSNVFYDGLLLDGVSSGERQFENLNTMWFKKEKPLMFICSDGKESFGASATSYLNEKEVEIIEDIVLRLLKSCVNGDQIGIITPYNSQKNEIIRRLSSNKQIPEEQYNNIEIASVDSFQGREKDFIILSTVRSNTQRSLGFLKNSQRLNVSITRAKYGLIVIGNVETLSNDPLWSNYIQFFIRNNVLVYGPIDNLKEYPAKIEPKELPTVIHPFTPKRQVFGDFEPLDDMMFIRRGNNFSFGENPMSKFMLGSGNVEDDDNWGMTQSEDYITASEIDPDQAEMEDSDEFYDDDYDDGYTYL